MRLRVARLQLEGAAELPCGLVESPLSQKEIASVISHGRIVRSELEGAVEKFLRLFQIISLHGGRGEIAERGVEGGIRFNGLAEPSL